MEEYPPKRGALTRIAQLATNRLTEIAFALSEARNYNLESQLLHNLESRLALQIEQLGLMVEANNPKGVNRQSFVHGVEIFCLPSARLDAPAARRICLPNMGFTMPGYYGYYSQWPEEMEALSRHAGMGTSYLEIGSLCGVLACFLAETHPGLNVTCVDPFQAGHATQSGVKDIFLRNVEAHGGGRVRLIEGYSHGVLPTLPADSFDAILVDGDHSHNAVLSDARNAYRIVKPGGRILFHDYSYVEETTRAVDAFLLEIGAKLAEQKSSLAVVEIPDKKAALPGGA